MQNTDTALFACYVLFIYFRGRNLTRIQREMRALGYPKFHRRILYPRGPKPGWIAKHNWQSSLDPDRNASVNERGDRAPDLPGNTATLPRNAAAHPGNAGAPACMSAKHETADDQPKDRQPTAPEVQPPTDFPAWLKTYSPNMTWSWPHQQLILEKLQAVTDGDCKRLMIFLPPRHGKSELVTVRYTAWRMQRKPELNVIVGGYNQRLANRFSRKIRKVIADAEAKSVPPAVAGGLPQAAAGHPEPQHSPKTSAHHSQEGRLAPANPAQQTLQQTQTGPPSDTSGGKPAFPTETGQTDSARRTNSRGEPSCSPFPFISSRPANTVSEWETAAGGGFRAVGVGGGVTGFGASLVVIDDPVKSRAEAESETYRQRVWDWFKDDIYTRLEPDGAVILIQTRWHEDDLAGRLLREADEEGGEQWDIVNLPAIAETVENEECGMMNDECEPQDSSFIIQNSSLARDWRSPGEPLCPERFSLADLERIRRRLGEYSFSALYQQRPTPAGGGIFRREWFGRVVDYAPPGLRWARGYDLAVSTKTSADYTTSFRCAFDREGNLYISGGFRRRLEYPDQRRFLIERLRAETDTQHGVELALHGNALLQDVRRERGVRGHLLRGVRVTADKITRALTWAPLAEEGKIVLVRRSPEMRNAHDPITPASAIPHSAFRIPHSPWISDFLDEIAAFPNGPHDDQIDAVSIAVQMLKAPIHTARGW